jgi:hypothetical protein
VLNIIKIIKTTATEFQDVKSTIREWRQRMKYYYPEKEEIEMRLNSN